MGDMLLLNCMFVCHNHVTRWVDDQSVRISFQTVGKTHFVYCKWTIQIRLGNPN